MRLVDSVVALFRRLRRFERREVREFRAWIETTRNLIRLTSLVVIPLILGFVTFISHVNPALSFLLFPPLASGTHTLFSDPKGKYSTPVNLVGGLTIGALCGWCTLVMRNLGWFQLSGEVSTVSPTGAAVSIFLTGVITWILDVEISAGFSTALLVLLTSNPSDGGVYVVSIGVSSAIVATVYYFWRRSVYAERAQYLYQSTKGDDHVLIPTHGADTETTAMLGAILASAHDAGKVVLLELTEEDDADDGEREIDAVVSTLETRAQEIRTKVGVPCEVVVANEGASPARTVVHTATETNCDLIAVPFETRYGSLSPFIRELFTGDTDVLVHRSVTDRRSWNRVLVTVRRESDVAHSMIDFAVRLVGRTGSISVAHCISDERDRRSAEEMLAHLTETVATSCETRVAHMAIEQFLETYGPSYDLIIVGASQERSAASRFIAPPTFNRLDSIDTDIAVLDRNFRI